ncbi:MAG TPA: N-6 DNA methylase [Phycisphaerae bacterium]|nr:N-6 DNA methylase [Phycisphaerae bacterium]HNU45225.1 N-6 DNA methylase [Phycisphaerae bacterium]
MGAATQQLTDYLERLHELRRHGASEDSIRDGFLSFLRAAFPRVEEAEPIVLEKHIPGLRVRGGFADALYGDLILEFKRRLDEVGRADGQAELTRYITNQRHPERYLGVLTDGETLEVYGLREGSLGKIDQLRLTASDAERASLWLDCYLFHEKNLVPTANDVALRFGERSPSFWRTLRVLESLWRQAGAAAPTQTKLAEWQSLLSIVYGSRVGDEDLFLRHTYLALFARVLAFVALGRRAPDGDALAGVVTGEVFERMGLENFVGDDFFTWVDAPECRPRTYGMLAALGTRLTVAYDLSAIKEDLLKELYQELVDPETRHDLGEFYTPDWLAELTLREAGFPGPGGASDGVPSLLDPACGSGTFLFTAIRLLRESGRDGAALADFCAHHLAGLDVHPLAVIIAKTNLVLALGDDLSRFQQVFTLPIFMANTLGLELPRMQAAPEGRPIRVPIDLDALVKRSGKSRPRIAPEFHIPPAPPERAEVLHQLVDHIVGLGDPGVEEKDALAGLDERLNELTVPPAHRHFWRDNLRLMRWLLEPPATDSVWRFILKNAYQPELLARRKFAFVVGNPPWLSYRYIERRDYQQRVRELVFFYELLGKRQAHLFTHMELATVFFALGAERFLAERGTLAFVMPRSIITGAKQHVAFADRYLRCARLIVDCERVAPLFHVPACAVIWERTRTARGKDAGRGAPTVRLQGEFPVRNASLAQAMKHLERSEGVHHPPGSTAPSPYWEQVTQGASIVPRCLWFVCPPATARLVDKRRPYLQTDSTIERQAKPAWKGKHVEGPVEADFLYATLLSDHMVPFGWRRLSVVVLPLGENADGERRLLDSDAAVRLGKLGLADWLRAAAGLWAKHGKHSQRIRSVSDRLDFGRCLTRQRPSGVLKLLYNTSGTHLCACLVDARSEYPKTISGLPVGGFVAQHTTYWYESVKPNEAHFLCAVLNAATVDRVIKPLQAKGAFGAQHGGGERHICRLPFEVLPIPEFSGSDGRHRELAKLSRRCHDLVGRFLAEPDEKTMSMPIGRLRTQIRREVIADELARIDALVVELLAEPPAS